MVKGESANTPGTSETMSFDPKPEEPPLASGPATTDTKTIQLKSSPGGVSYADPVSEADEPIPAVEEEMPLTAAQQRRQEIAERRQAMQERQAETQVMCERHRQRLEQMEPARRVYYRDENGQEVRMDDVQRVSLIEESREYVAENCQ